MPNNVFLSVHIHQPLTVTALEDVARIKLDRSIDLFLDAGLIDSLVSQLMMASEELRLRGAA